MLWKPVVCISVFLVLCLTLAHGTSVDLNLRRGGHEHYMPPRRGHNLHNRDSYDGDGRRGVGWSDNKGDGEPSSEDGNQGSYSNEQLAQLKSEAKEYSTGREPIPAEIRDREAQLCYQCEQSIQIIGGIIQPMHWEVIENVFNIGGEDVSFRNIVCDQIQNNNEACTMYSNGQWYIPRGWLRCIFLHRQCETYPSEIVNAIRGKIEMIKQSEVEAKSLAEKLIAVHCPFKHAWSNINPGGAAETVPVTCQYYIDPHWELVLDYAAVGEVDLNYCYDIDICQAGTPQDLDSMGWWYSNSDVGKIGGANK